jgi:predicted dehydrogenase
MFFEAHRLSVFTPRALDVDVVLDLMIHDLDIVLTFANSPVREVRAVGLPILSPKVDIANVRVEFESGCVANFTASRVSTERVRKLRFFQPRQYVSIDYARRELLAIKLDANVTPEIAAAIAGGRVDPALIAQLAASAAAAGLVSSPNPGLSFVKPPVVQGEPLRLEIESFLDSARTRREPLVTGRQGRDALALALEIQAAMVTHAHRAGLQDFFSAGA